MCRLPMHGGRSQLALDATIVSPLMRLGEAHPRRRCRARLHNNHCSAPEATSNLSRSSPGPAMPPLVVCIEVGAAGWCSSFACSRDTGPSLSPPLQTGHYHRLGCVLVRTFGRRSVRWQLLCWSFRPLRGSVTDPCPTCTTDALRLGWLRSPWIAPLVAAPRNSYRRGHSGQVQKNDGATYCFCRLLELFH